MRKRLLNKKYHKLAKLHYEHFRTWRISQLIVNLRDSNEKFFYTISDDEMFFDYLNAIGFYYSERNCPPPTKSQESDRKALKLYKNKIKGEYDKLFSLHVAYYNSNNIISFFKYIMEIANQDIFYMDIEEITKMLEDRNNKEVSGGEGEKS